MVSTASKSFTKSRCSRYHVVIQAAQKRAAHPAKAQLAEALIIRYRRRLADHRCFIDQHSRILARLSNGSVQRLRNDRKPFVLNAKLTLTIQDATFLLAARVIPRHCPHQNALCGTTCLSKPNFGTACPGFFRIIWQQPLKTSRLLPRQDRCGSC